ncbi:MAG: hypothetical protein OXE50_09600 [Chloroflexi bacterium]|nr:hypothetical protein [Chloroflexota bacterium]
MPASTRLIPAPRPFDFALTAAHQTNYRGKAGSDLFVDGTYYRALWSDDGPLGVAARPVEESIEVSLPNGGPPGALDTAAERVAWLLGLDVEVDGFYEMLVDDPVLSDAVGSLRGLRHTRTETVWEALVHAVVGQQVSSVVARVIRDGIVTEYGAEVKVDGRTIHSFPRPQTLLDAGHDALRALKLSARKAEYVLGIAETALRGELDHETLAPLTDEEAVAVLSGIRGVGRWTAQWTLMRALGRVDALPAGDLALQRVVGEHYFDGKRLTEQELDRFAEERWKPYRGLAVTYLFSRIRQERVAREAARTG